VKAAADYTAPAITDVRFNQGAVPNLADDILSDLDKAKFNDRRAPDTRGILEDMKTPIAGRAHTLEDLETTRQMLGKVAGNFNDPVEQAAASKSIKAIDKYMSSLSQNDLAAGNAKLANDALTTARQNYALGSAAERVQEKLNNAELQAKSTNSGHNLNNAQRQKLRAFLTSKKQGRGLSDEDLAGIEDVVTGSRTSNAMRTAGNLLGNHTFTAGAIGAALLGHPEALLAPAAGYGLKFAGNALAKREAAKIVDNILARSPEGKQWAAMQQRMRQANPRGSIALRSAFVAGLNR
jgi:hypothetical protein